MKSEALLLVGGTKQRLYKSIIAPTIINNTSYLSSSSMLTRVSNVECHSKLVISGEL